MTQTDEWTVGRLLSWTTDYFQKNGVDDPRLEAEVLLAEARGCQRIDLYAAFTEAASEKTRTAFRELVRLRADGAPVAYLVGHREFYSMRFRVSPDVLIPRPETEHLVVALLDHIRDGKSAGRWGEQTPIRIADVGTGSGILAVCAARHCPQARLTAIDVHPPALEIAKYNARQHAVAEQIAFVQSDLFTEVDPEGRFDFVLSNPPYVSTSEFASLDPLVRNHEPEIALHAGEKGTEVIERLLPQAAERLEAGGWLLCEISPMIQAAVEQLVTASERFQLGETLKDHAGLARVVQAQRTSG